MSDPNVRVLLELFDAAAGGGGDRTERESHVATASDAAMRSALDAMLRADRRGLVRTPCTR